MQPAAFIGNGGSTMVRRMKGSQSNVLGPAGTVNDEEFWRKKVQDVPASHVGIRCGYLTKRLPLIVQSVVFLQVLQSKTREAAAQEGENREEKVGQEGRRECRGRRQRGRLCQ